MDPETKKTVLRLFRYTLHVLTVPCGQEGHGITVNWLTQASFDPPMLAVSIENRSKTIQLLRQHRVFAINMLGSDQAELAGRLGRSSARSPDKFKDVPTKKGSTGVPLLSDSLGYLECRVTAEVGAGDSTVFVGEIVDAGLGREGDPLTMAAAGFRHAG